MEIIKYLGKRIVSLVIVLFGISLVAFFLGTASPGDPAEEVLRRNGVELPTEQQLEDMREELGLTDHGLNDIWIGWKMLFMEILELLFLIEGMWVMRLLGDFQ